LFPEETHQSFQGMEGRKQERTIRGKRKKGGFAKKNSRRILHCGGKGGEKIIYSDKRKTPWNREDENEAK